MKIKLKNIVMDDSIQCRARLDMDVIDEYYERMQDGDKFPPVVLFGTSERCWIGDGWHRIEAAKGVTFQDIEAELKPGDRKDALKYALSANFTHGHRRTNEDKRRCVEIALREFPKESSRQISEMCGVGYDLVQRMKPELTDSVNATVTTKDGRQYPATRTKTQRHTETETETEEPRGVDMTVSENGVVHITGAVGIVFSKQAINSLKQIPKRDPERKQGIDLVVAWIGENL